ncbi:MAG: hypothetical protein OSB45_07705 [Pseudomonadales bacterium]|nr:hypothetical protein [Pseudomonadales bacterium]
MPELTSKYHGSTISIGYSDRDPVELKVNGIIRDKAEQADYLKLTTSVQTGYEWHEWVEGVFLIRQQQIQLTLTCNNETIADQSFDPDIY